MPWPEIEYKYISVIINTTFTVFDIQWFMFVNLAFEYPVAYKYPRQTQFFQYKKGDGLEKNVFDGVKFRNDMMVELNLNNQKSKILNIICINQYLQN